MLTLYALLETFFRKSTSTDNLYINAEMNRPATLYIFVCGTPATFFHKYCLQTVEIKVEEVFRLVNLEDYYRPYLGLLTLLAEQLGTHPIPLFV